MTVDKSCPDYSSWNDWRAEEYLAEYYSEVMPDEQFALEFLCESLKKMPDVPVALDYGCGPTVHHAFALIPKALEIHLADYIDNNLAAIKTWIESPGDAHDWGAFTRYILQLENQNEPSEVEIRHREQEGRQRISTLRQSDAGDTDPLGEEMRGYYPLVTTHYCAEGATNDKSTWARYMKNIASLVKPGGALIMSACGAADYYYVGDKAFPCAGVNAHDVLGCLQDNGFMNIDLRVRQVPDHSTQGYSSVIFAHATKRS